LIRERSELCEALREYKEKQELWKKVAEEIKKIIIKSQKYPSENNKLWVSTHGLGVAWVHIRLSIIPKYYKTKKYITKL
jgi:protoheme ferro-lyase